MFVFLISPPIDIAVASFRPVLSFHKHIQTHVGSATASANPVAASLRLGYKPGGIDFQHPAHPTTTPPSRLSGGEGEGEGVGGGSVQIA